MGRTISPALLSLNGPPTESTVQEFPGSCLSIVYTERDDLERKLREQLSLAWVQVRDATTQHKIVQVDSQRTYYASQVESLQTAIAAMRNAGWTPAERLKKGYLRDRVRSACHGLESVYAEPVFGGV